MKIRNVVLFAAVVIASVPAVAQYTPYFTDSLSTYNATNWNLNCAPYTSAVFGASGLGPGPGTYGSVTDSCSLVSLQAVPDGTSSYGVKATLHLDSALLYSSWRYAHIYLHVASGSNPGSGTGSYYDVSYGLSGTAGGCQVQISEVTPARGTQLLAVFSETSCGALSLVDGSTIRATINDSGTISAFINDIFAVTVTNTDLSTGQPGIGLVDTGNFTINPSTDGLSNVELGPADRTPPATPAATDSAFASHVDFTWPAVSDGTSGTGVAYYQIYRNDSWMYTTLSGLSWSDTTVQPGTFYVYTLLAVDMFGNTSTQTLNVTTPGSPSGSPNPPDGSETGVRPTGTYWGVSPEQIDVLSGNVNYTIPLTSPKSRNGWSVPFSLSYNSQNWRQSSGTSWSLGADVGYGYGWRLSAGSLLPVWSGSTLLYYSYTDSTGAQYRLDVNSGSIWSSRDSVYVEYDASANRLYFRDGTFWVMGDTSASGEPDAGTMYPTVMEDTNGNQLFMYYMGSASARLQYILDMRGWLGFSYDGTNHLRYLSGPDQVATINYTSITLSSPFGGSGSFGTAYELSSATTLLSAFNFTYASDNSATLIQATLPYGGYVGWNYDSVTYSGGATYQEVQNRFLSKDGISTPTTYPFSHEMSVANVHQFTTIDDPGGTGEKYWAFSLSGANTGMVTQYQGREMPGAYNAVQNDLTWTQDSVGNLYISSNLTSLDFGQTFQVQKQSIQNVDIHGNVTQLFQYDYNNLTTPARIYSYTYANPSGGFSAMHMYNRVQTVTLASSLSTSPLTLVTNAYDGGNVMWSGGSPPSMTLFDSTYYTCCYRGNLWESISLTGAITSYYYNFSGAVTQVNAPAGTSTAVTLNASMSYAVPSQITTGTIQNNLGFDGNFNPTSSVGQNGDATSTSYDVYGRLVSATSPFGASTYTSHSGSPYSASSPAVNVSTISPSGHFTKTTLDGLGRPIKAESGPSTGTTSVVETSYASCGCSPGGKMNMVSLPHAPGASPSWTTYTYDGVGRTLSVAAPDGSTTAYVYQGNTVKVTDAALNWKLYTSDAFGHLTEVDEPNPAGGSNYVTTYTYDSLDHLTQVNMPRPTGTQTRTFAYNAVGLLVSATNPENGTVHYTYDSYKRLSTVTDAKGQQKVYTYDSIARVTQISRFYPSGGSLVEDTSQRTNYYYDTNPFDSVPYYSNYIVGRLAAVQYGGGHCTTLGPPRTGCDTIQEWYNYGIPGGVVGKRVRVIRGSASGNLNSTVTFDSEGRVTNVTYPSWSNSGTTVPGSSYNYAYDGMDRLNTMTDALASSAVISGMTYGVANEPLSMSGLLSETRTYNSLFQLTEISVPSVLDIKYGYPAAGSNNGKLASQTDVLSGETVVYTYDALTRLASAQTSAGSPTWGQSYNYDGFGNLTDQNVILGSAPTMHVTYDPTTNRQTGESADANGNIGSGNLFDIDNRLLQPSGGAIQYAYGASNKRVWRGSTSPALDEIDYWLGNKKLGAYQCVVSGTTISFTLTGTNLYFGSRLIGKGTVNLSGINDKVTLASVATDRLRSIGKFYPFGQERPSATTNDTEKFTGYFRDAATGLDYAKARYEQPGVGRFMTPDPFSRSATVRVPGSWNRYAYVGGDPINRVDRLGLDQAWVDADSDACVMYAGAGCDGGGGGEGPSYYLTSVDPNSATAAASIANGQAGAIPTDQGLPVYTVNSQPAYQSNADYVLSTVLQGTQPLTEVSTWAAYTVAATTAALMNIADLAVDTASLDALYTVPAPPVSSWAITTNDGALVENITTNQTATEAGATLQDFGFLPKVSADGQATIYTDLNGSTYIIRPSGTAPGGFAGDYTTGPQPLKINFGNGR